VNTAIDPEMDILIVEDSPTQAQRLRHLLEQQGYRVRHAANGRQALDAAHHSKPALVISDVIMPEMDGFEFCRLLKSDASLSHIPVMLVTTLSDAGDVIRGLECRADNFILKPYDERYLISRVQFVLVNHQMRQQDQGGLAVEIFFNGQRHIITADRLQILNLLLSTYDAAIQRNKDLTRVQQELTERGAVLARREREIQEAKAFLENLIAASPSIIFRLEPRDDDFTVTYVSANIDRLLGYGAVDVVGKPRFWKDLIHPEDHDVLMLALRSALSNTVAPIEHEFRGRGKDGQYRSFVSTIRREQHEQGGPAAILFHALDITARRRAEDNTRRAESFLNSILENVPSTIFVKDARELRFVRVNHAIEHLVGRPRSEMLGKTVYDLFSADEADCFTATDREALEGQTLIDTPEETLCTATRGVRLVHTRKVPIFDEHGAPEYLLGISEDVTERKASEQALAAAKSEADRANRAKSDFLSRMSHDLRTPLNAILGFAQLLEIDTLTAEQHESIRHILKGGGHLLDLINEVLDLARIESGHLSLSPEPVAICEIVQDVVELVWPLAARRGVTLQDEASQTCGTRHLLADRSRINQILLNLLSNAVKYNREGGHVRVTCDDVPGNRVRIKVTDTGAGISPDKLQLLFEPFERLGAEQTTIEGTGLGLALSKALAEAMGGTLGVETEVDRGSTFWVELALAEAPGETASAVRRRPDASRPDSSVTGTVLYIEDNVSNQRLMERVCAQRPGVRLVGAANGQTGLDLARAEAPDLILLDLHLPDINGDEVLRRLWEDLRTRTIPVAVLSADANPAQARRLLAAGASAYLTKPLNISQVLKLLDDMLKQQSVRTAHGCDSPHPDS
jgi:PAS domain S-box-containing protein